ncbi:class I SAM-dependent methyltransferase [uncultured Meiothermus sp.]|uniref:class I SAM-dependent methyltransferase n=1 Tax=uncultured Meiothermus sp. TaxID=157471 RepID=UPI00262D493B|nr:class I SAM-dependent methyltransferase [uncultured Meiothermus sp.]
MSESYLDQQQQVPNSLAVQTNLVPIVATGYEIWRKRALTLLSGRPFPLHEEFALLLKAVQPVAGSQFLDLGTSTGLYARALLEAGAAQVYALDLSRPMLKVALQKARGYAGFVPLLARAEAIPLPQASLDGVVVGGSWNEFPNPQAVAAEVYRVLKPGGRLWIMFSHRSNSPLQRVLEWTGLRFPALPELMNLLSSSGFNLDGWRERSAGFVTGTKVTLR